ncbi:MMPL family transporter [Streptomyces sp. KMM 9044]|uniref:MMPL family transporter n=1 Tax=Streptomyces sp. KMM 9044 TaxID=2744474 RepID=UPI00215124FF|nr:MMPL family transporter [Streptomyces sp. KMM 9044]WAX76355.1 MMPL family transporter [Streptomyces sp. KMM 9044]
MTTLRSRTVTRSDDPGIGAGFLARYARLVSGRRSKWAVLVIWLVLIAAGGSLAAKLGDVQDNDPETWLPSGAQSTQAVELAEKYFADKDSSTAVIIYARGSGLTAADQEKIEADRSALQDDVAVGDVAQPQVSEDGKAAFLGYPLRTHPSDNGVLTDAVDESEDIVKNGAPDGLDIRIAGEAGSVRDFAEVYSGMDGALLGAALGVVAVLLLMTYRSPVLWLVPLLTVFLASQVASGVVYLLAKHAGLLVNGLSAYILMILCVGVGTDYALLLIARYREELHRHEDRHEAMRIAVRHSLPALAASAATVGVATLCLVFGSMNSTRGLGPVVAIGVAVVFLAMTSLLPALLVILGRWTFWPFVPRYAPGYDAGVEKEHGAWARVAQAVGRRPRLIWAASLGVLAVLAIGTTTVETGQTQAEQFTKTVDSVEGQRLLAEHFPAGSSAPADIYVPAGGADAALRTVQAVTGVESAATQRTAGGWTHLTAVFEDAPDTQAAKDTVERMRTALDKGQEDSADAVVGGQAAIALDTSDAQQDEEMLLIPLILVVVLLMLILVLRAVVAPLVLLASVVLSYASAVGAASLLFHAIDYPRIDRGLLLIGFLFLVALGVDYTIFLMARVREEVRLRGHREGTLTGLTVTGGVITSAGVVLAATFCVLAAIPTVASLQQGLLIAIGILLDTFLVRSLLIPALSLGIGPRIWRPGHPEDEAPPRSERPLETARVDVGA